MRQDHKEAEAAITHLLTLVEKGLMDADAPSLRERLVGLKLRRDELSTEIADLNKRITSGEPIITPEKIEKFASLLSDKLTRDSPDLKQAYARLVMAEVTVMDRKSGSRDRGPCSPRPPRRVW
jgi:hypothetical protein